MKITFLITQRFLILTKKKKEKEKFGKMDFINYKQKTFLLRCSRIAFFVHNKTVCNEYRTISICVTRTKVTLIFLTTSKIILNAKSIIFLKLYERIASSFYCYRLI